MNRRKFVTLSSLGALGTLLLNCTDAKKILLKKNYTIACLGDSITAKQDGYVQLLQQYVDKNHPGQRPYLFERLDQLLNSTHVDIILFCYGINCGIYGTPSPTLFDSYTIGIYSFLEKIKLKGTKAILLTPPPLALEAVPITTKSSDTAYGYRNPYPNYEDEVLLKFCGIIKSVRHSNVLGTIDIHTPLVKHQQKCYENDPIHPNKAGHQLIMDTVVDHLTI
ncbi:SGNH/GDSL hydrolase family protein [Maribacter sp. R77961]|uniref:SGNH/GDSL hydrolase family protein n=1 Tax=Maribacter sp. R77961 TaxID=3093871 RepID=UPI0037C7C563